MDAGIKTKNYLYTASALFLLLSLVLLLKDVSLWIFSFSLLSFVFTGYILSFFKMDRLYKLLVLTLPFSINTEIGSSGTTVLIPSEPLTGIIALTLFFALLSGREKTGAAFLKHPLSLLILCYLLFQLGSLIFSTMPFVSLKSFVVKSVYILAFYFAPYILLRKEPVSANKIYLLFALALLPVIVYTLIIHAGYHFSKEVSAITPFPFFSDHTIYSACLAFVIPPLLVSLFFSGTFGTGFTGKTVLVLLLTALFAGVFLSFCRAAWMSLFASALLFTALFLKIQWKGFVLLFFTSAVLLFLGRESILDEIKQNRSDSNRKNADIVEQTKSIANITSDQSNAERLNRWTCALRMAADKPFTGFGTGTYQFRYLDYQRKSEMTGISVTSPYNIKPGHGGSAHSEYLLALSESGIGGFICFVGIVVAGFFYGIKNYYGASTKSSRLLALMALSGLCTYFTHAFFNNFLDVDKAAFLFWFSLSLLTVIDLQEKEKKLSSAVEPL